jgi:hypothetical protein
MTDPNACETCPLARPKEPPSAFLAHLLYLEQMQAAGAQFAYSDLTRDEWHGLVWLKSKRNEKQIKEMKTK